MCLLLRPHGFPATMTHSACVVPKLRGGPEGDPEPPERCRKQRSCSRTNQYLRIRPYETLAKGKSAWTEGNRQLMWSGMLLFLLGLVTGLLEQRFTNVRMGLSAHLEGVMNGTFLVALGAIWTE